MSATTVIKRSDKRPAENYDPNKLQASIRAVCLSERTAESHADMIANEVSSAVSSWLADKTEVTSSDIRRQAAKTLAIHHPDAAYLYQHHNSIV